MRLGIDFGRVISGGEEPEMDSDFLHGSFDTAMSRQAVTGVWEVVPQLVDLFDGQAWIVSKCGERIEQRTLSWLDHHDFYARTGLDRDNVRFCRKRPDKAIHASQLGLSHFIDDRLDVLHHLRDIVTYRFLFGPQDEPAPDWVVSTPTWQDVLVAMPPRTIAAVKLKLDLHDIFNRGHDIERALQDIIAEAVRKKAALVEIIPGKGSGQLKRRVLRFLDQKEIKVLYHRVEKDSKNFGRVFVHFRWKQ